MGEEITNKKANNMIFFPIPVWLFLSPAIIYILKLIGWFYRKVKGKRLAVLGMKGAGKTRFYRYLQNKPYIEGESGVDEYEEFEYKKQDGMTIYIRKGKDIGGSEDYINLYEDMIKECIPVRSDRRIQLHHCWG